uniref:SFRICE_006979 n=1 Tax=Spodoptera frugiperda TaxID=7108 RepID=A0A2H1WC09_SPOFR
MYNHHHHLTSIDVAVDPRRWWDELDDYEKDRPQNALQREEWKEYRCTMKKRSSMDTRNTRGVIAFIAHRIVGISIGIGNNSQSMGAIIFKRNTNKK